MTGRALQEYILKLINSIHDDFSILIKNAEALEKQTLQSQKTTIDFLKAKRNFAIENLELVLERARNLK